MSSRTFASPVAAHFRRNLSHVHTMRLLTWNCRSGSTSTRLSELAEYSPDLVFLQECTPTEAPPFAGEILTRRVAPGKGIALAATQAGCLLAELESRVDGGKAFIAASVTGAVAFTALGIWSQGPRYVDDVMRTLDAYGEVLACGAAVVMGDFNSGTRLGERPASTKGHSRIVDGLERLGLVSAYHAFHRIAHGEEQDATHLHLFRPSRPWHIDFCFVPAGWVDNLLSVDVIAGEEWAKRSDHFPLKVDVRLP